MSTRGSKEHWDDLPSIYNLSIRYFWTHLSIRLTHVLGIQSLSRYYYLMNKLFIRLMTCNRHMDVLKYQQGHLKILIYECSFI
jgi:hypothetical protein